VGRSVSRRLPRSPSRSRMHLRLQKLARATSFGSLQPSFAAKDRGRPDGESPISNCFWITWRGSRPRSRCALTGASGEVRPIDKLINAPLLAYANEDVEVRSRLARPFAGCCKPAEWAPI
jgi:hypothetical protein